MHERREKIKGAMEDQKKKKKSEKTGKAATNQKLSTATGDWKTFAMKSNSRKKHQGKNKSKSA